MCKVDRINGADMIEYDKPKAKTKLFELRDVFCFANAEKATEYLGKDCYFGSSLEDLAHSVEQNYNCFKLYHLDLGRNDGKVFEVDTGVDFLVASYCLPKVKVIRPDAKYRPFKDLDEFANFLKTDVEGLVGTKLRYRTISEPKKYISMITKVCSFGSAVASNVNCVALGCYYYSFEELFNLYEFWTGEKWVPFGVLENESY